MAKDAVEAAKWDRKAAEQGESYGQCQLGSDYYSGDGVLQDFKTASEWFLRSANQGLEYAQLKIGLMYEEGVGVQQNFILAYKWLNLAAAQGDTNAINFRLLTAQKMTREQLAEAQRLSSEFVPE